MAILVTGQTNLKVFSQPVAAAVRQLVPQRIPPVACLPWPMTIETMDVGVVIVVLQLSCHIDTCGAPTAGSA